MTGKRLGFFTAKETDGARSDAWCGACEQVRIAEGGDWNERSQTFAGISLICTKCYDQARERNEPPAKKNRLLFWKK